MENLLIVGLGIVVIITVLVLWIFASALKKYRQSLTPDTYDGREKKEDTREEAKINSQNEKKCRSEQAKITIWKWWLALFALIILIDIVIAAVVASITIVISSKVMAMAVFFIALAVCLVISGGILFKVCYKKVEENWEWVIEFFGKWFTTWGPGLHFLFPFFMSVKAQVFMGDQMITLYMDEKERDGEVNAMIEFTNTSSAVIVRLFYCIFSSHRAVYNIDNVVKAVREKIDAGLRAYFGTKKLDEAITERVTIDIETIIGTKPINEVEKKEIVVKAADPKIFKFWGAEMRSLAVVDISLPKEVKEQRNKILIAEKDRDAAKIKKTTAQHEAEAERTRQEVRGKATGQEIKKVMDETGLNARQAAEYLLNKKYFESITPSKGIIIAGQGTGAPLIGAELAAALSLTTEKVGNVEKGAVEKPDTEKTDKTKKPKEDKKGGDRK